MKYVYPNLAGNPHFDYAWFRVGGPGLANCLFVACRAYILAKKTGAKMFSPTWAKFSIGPYIRREKDKRHYIGLFNNNAILPQESNFRKFFTIRGNMFPEFEIENFEKSENGVLHVVGLGNYFQDLNPTDANEYFSAVINPAQLKELEGFDFSNCVAIHVRLGDYTSDSRISINWFIGVINHLHDNNPTLKFLLFSDGSDDELKSILTLPYVQKVFFGNALADIIGISRCCLVIASDSTFSAWGAFLGKCPVIFSKRHFPPLNKTTGKEFVIGESVDIPKEIEDLIHVKQ